MTGDSIDKPEYGLNAEKTTSEQSTWEKSMFVNTTSSRLDWCIITQDRLTRNPLEKEALRRSGLIAFILAKGWLRLNEWDKAWHLVRWWPRILEQAALVEGGAAFQVPVRFSGKGKFTQIRL